jgi:hypothetical protein
LPDNPSFIPDEAKGEILKFFATPAWQTVLLALKSRRPKSPVFSDQLHTIACEYSFQEGFDAAIAAIAQLPLEYAQPDKAAVETVMEQKLLDPRD